MSQFDSILSSMKQEAYPVKKQLLEYLLQALQKLQKSRKPLDPADKSAILSYAYGEVDAFLLAIPKTASYQEKDQIFECEDLVLGLIMHLCPEPGDVPRDVLTKIQLLVDLVARERYIETTIDEMFQQESIGEAEVRHLLFLVDSTDDEYRKSKLYAGLIYYREAVSKLSDGAKARLATHIAAELRRYLGQEKHSQDHINNLEIISDVSKYFANDEIVGLLRDVMKLGYCNINFFAAETLLAVGESIPAGIITALAQDLEYANLTYGMLGKYGKQSLFPREYASPEYLAKSDMVHWLMYPTELGKAPDAIEYVGKITYLFKKTVYYVFKFRSDSDTLDDKQKNKWLIGWSSEDGGTFSNFDEYALYEKATIDATLKNIKKNLIG